LFTVAQLRRYISSAVLTVTAVSYGKINPLPTYQPWTSRLICFFHMSPRKLFPLPWHVPLLVQAVAAKCFAELVP